VAEFDVSKLPLSSDAARHKFKVLAGCRYDTVNDTFKIGCNRFPVQKMNEKWCSDTIVKLLAEAEVLFLPSLCLCLNLTRWLLFFSRT
jgi:small subunit ribosomal protein S35